MASFPATLSAALIAIAVVTAPGDALAGTTSEPSLLKALRERYPGTSIDSVHATAMPSVYEVWMGNNVAFVHENNLQLLIFGRLVDLSTLQDLTGKNRPTPPAQDTSRDASPSIPWSALPLGDALRSTVGTGARQLVLFTDPHCHYCQKLDAELEKLKDVTVFNFMVPFSERTLPIAIWCAPDPLNAWKSAMQGHSVLQRQQECPHPIDRNLDLAKRYGIRGTPTLVLPTGAIHEGYMDANAINAAIGAASAPNAQ